MQAFKQAEAFNTFSMNVELAHTANEASLCDAYTDKKDANSKFPAWKSSLVSGLLPDRDVFCQTRNSIDFPDLYQSDTMHPLRSQTGGRHLKIVVLTLREN
jgi:hypothetical protein